MNLFFYFLLFHMITANPTFILQDADQFESPWYTLLIIDDTYCGGSLVNNDYIITAAHCFDTIDDFEDKSTLQEHVKVRFGEWKTKTDPDCEYGVDGEFCERFVEIPPQQLIIHEDYKSKTGFNRYNNDIAIIKLEWPPRPSEAIENIELPSSDDCKKQNDNEIWTVTGFGHIPVARTYSTTKKKIDMKMISYEECENKLGTTNYISYYGKDKNICGVGINNETTCIGDSGSGITTTRGDSSILQGIVSFGISECGEAGVPSVFVKLACYSVWIESKIKDLEEQL